jgi:type II secretory pathway component GspD/PulD (secretin)
MFIKSLISRVKIRKDLFVWCFVLVAMAAIAVADVGQTLQVPDANGGVQTVQDGATQPQSAVVITETKLEPVEGVEAGGDIQSLTFKKDTSIRDALRFLAAKYQKNIVPSSKVEGLITVTSLYDVTFEEALNSILGHNFRYDEQGNFIKIYTAEEYKKIKEDKERMTYEVFSLFYTSAAEAKKLVSQVLSSVGKIEATSPSATGVPIGESISAPTGAGDAVAMHDAIIIYDYPENIKAASEVLKLIDVRPKQVLVEATILSATLTEGTELGIDWSTLKGVAITGGIGMRGGINSSNVTRSPGLSSGGINIGITADGIDAFIKAVETVTDVTIMANPKILAVNKQLGQVYIGKKVSYRENTATTLAGESLAGTIKFLDTGTKLSFRPYISDDGYIRMDIHPKDSSSTLNTTSSAPDETSAELVTNVIVKDGQTIVIGGLFRDKVSSSKTQIPLLGDIPLIGVAFRGKTDTTERQEVIILLTPHIVTDAEQTEGLARVEDIQRKRFGAKDGVQWIGRARLAEDAYGRAAKYYLEGQKDKALKELNSSLQLRPTYLEAIRLKERITGDKSSEDAAMIERNVVSVVEQKDHDKWLRR